MWDESKHPRDKYGKFTTTDYVKMSTDELKRLCSIYDSDAPPYNSRQLLPISYKLPDEQLPHSVGSLWKNYDILDLKTGMVFKFVDGSKIQNIEVFCGYGTRKEYHNAYKYADRIGGLTKEWQHVKGIGLIDTPEGHLRAEVHWSQHFKHGKHDFFIKKWID